MYFHYKGPYPPSFFFINEINISFMIKAMG